MVLNKKEAQHSLMVYRKLAVSVTKNSKPLLQIKKLLVSMMIQILNTLFYTPFHTLKNALQYSK